jgi:hypothetical protein
MNFNISFVERAKLCSIILSKQPPVTIEEARKQEQWLKINSSKKTHYYKPVIITRLKNDPNLGFYFE